MRPVIGHERRRRLKELRRFFSIEVFESLIAAVLIALLLRLFVFGIYRVPTESMLPTFLPGDIVLGFRASYGIPLPFSNNRLAESLPDRGDIVVFRPTQSRRESVDGNVHPLFLKRVVGLPGDRIEILDGRLIVNEQVVSVPVRETDSQWPPGIDELEESFAGSRYFILRNRDIDGASAYGPVIVPPEHVFLLGDFRSESADSRQWGPVPVKGIESRIAVILASFRVDGEAATDSARIRWQRFFSAVDGGHRGN